MKKIIFAVVATLFCNSFVFANSNVAPDPEEEQAATLDELDKYRRSSLCILLVTHQGTKYAEEMEKQFMQMELPERYNDHNIQLRVLHTDKSIKGKDVVSMLKYQNVAKDVVSKWFNRNSTSGQMDMNLIHERGGYNATVSDVEQADMTVRGRASLLDAGTELIQNTFVLVCDMEYKKRDDAGVWAGVGMGLLAAGTSVAGQFSGTDFSSTTQQLTQAAAELSDLSGFTVKMDAHLLQLDWEEAKLNDIFQNYWVDDQTPEAEARMRKSNYESNALQYDLNYLGHYKSSATTLAMKSESDLDAVLKEVTERTIDKSIKELALEFQEFRPRTRLMMDDDKYYAYIGTKEDVTSKTKFDVLETVRKKGRQEYKTVAKMKVLPYRIWDNKSIDMSSYVPKADDGTYMKRASGRRNLTEGTYQLRENVDIQIMGRKKWNFIMGAYAGYAAVPSASRYSKNRSGILAGLEMSELWNFSKHFSWSLVGMRLGARCGFEVNGYTGMMYHTNKIGRSKTCFFIWPTVGYSLVANKNNSPTFLDYGVRVGFNFKQLVYVSAEYGRYDRFGVNFGFELF